MNVRTSAAAVPGATSWMATTRPASCLAAASVSAAGRRAGEVTIRYSSPHGGQELLGVLVGVPPLASDLGRRPVDASAVVLERPVVDPLERRLERGAHAVRQPARRRALNVTVTSIDVNTRSARASAGRTARPGTCTPADRHVAQPAERA